jgi:hypothetical protein
LLTADNIADALVPKLEFVFKAPEISFNAFEVASYSDCQLAYSGISFVILLITDSFAIRRESDGVSHILSDIDLFKSSILSRPCHLKFTKSSIIPIKARFSDSVFHLGASLKAFST